MHQQNIIFVFLQVLKLAMEITVKVKDILRMQVRKLDISCLMKRIILFRISYFCHFTSFISFKVKWLDFHSNCNSSYFPIEPAEKAINGTSHSLTFSLPKPSKPFV